MWSCESLTNIYIYTSTYCSSWFTYKRYFDQSIQFVQVKNTPIYTLHFDQKLVGLQLCFSFFCVFLCRKPFFLASEKNGSHFCTGHFALPRKCWPFGLRWLLMAAMVMVTQGVVECQSGWPFDLPKGLSGSSGRRGGGRSKCFPKLRRSQNIQRKGQEWRWQNRCGYLQQEMVHPTMMGIIICNKKKVASISRFISPRVWLRRQCGNTGLEVRWM